MSDNLDDLSTLNSEAGELIQRLEAMCPGNPVFAARRRENAAAQAEVIQSSLESAQSGRVSGDRALAEAATAFSALEALVDEIGEMVGLQAEPADSRGLGHVSAAAGSKPKGVRSVLKRVRAAIRFGQGVPGGRLAEIAELEARQPRSLQKRKTTSERSPKKPDAAVGASQPEDCAAEVPRVADVAQQAPPTEANELDGFRWDFSINGPVEVRRDDSPAYRITRPVPMWLEDN